MKSIYILLCLIIISPAIVFAQWSPVSGSSGSLENTNSGYLKINSSSYVLLGEAIQGFAYYPIESGTGTVRYFLRFDYSGDASYPYLTNRTPSGKVVIKTGTAAGSAEATHFTVEGGDGVVKSYFEDTYLGIGDTNPLSPLTIEGIDETSNPDLRIKSKNSIISLGENQGGPHGIVFGDQDSEGLQLLYRTSPNALIVEKGNNMSDNEDLFSIDYDTEYGYFKNRVGIGTPDPSHKLTVAGSVKSREVIVEEDAGADFVFEEVYDLPTLEEVEEFVKSNKHLPGIASASEMMEEGVKVGELQMQLLQKIEELTLYTIEQQKIIESLSRRMKELEISK